MRWFHAQSSGFGLPPEEQSQCPGGVLSLSKRSNADQMEALLESIAGFVDLVLTHGKQAVIVQKVRKLELFSRLIVPHLIESTSRKLFSLGLAIVGKMLAVKPGMRSARLDTQRIISEYEESAANQSSGEVAHQSFLEILHETLLECLNCTKPADVDSSLGKT